MRVRSSFTGHSIWILNFCAWGTFLILIACLNQLLTYIIHISDIHILCESKLGLVSASPKRVEETLG